MKKIKLLSKVLLCFFVFSSAATLAEAQTSKIKVKLDIIWGRQSQGCKGWGICGGRISIEWGVNVEARMSGDKKTLILDVPLESTKGYEYMFEPDLLTIDEDFTFSQDIQERLQVTKPLKVGKGKYKKDKTSFGYTIYIPQY